jgi:ABC-2 type transport system permease protein
MERRSIKMKTIFKMTVKSALRDPYLLFWSILMPLAGMFILGLLVKTPGYSARVLTSMTAVSILFYSLVTTAFSILAQRRRGVYRLLRVTPMPLGNYVFGVSAAWAAVGMACGMLILAAGMLFFRVKLAPVPLLFMLAALFIADLGYVMFSFVLASFSRTEGHVSMLTNIVTLPMIFLSDAFYSFSNAPKIVVALSRINPFQWLLNVLYQGKHWDASACFGNMGLLFAVFVLGLLLAVKTFRYTES